MADNFDNISPNLPPPGSSSMLRTEPLNRPRGVDDQGSIVSPHPDMGTTIQDAATHFICTERAAVMHRPDGKKIDFVKGHYASIIKQDTKYLDDQIDMGHPYVRRATVLEREAWNMNRDPRGTMTAELTPIIEDRVRAEITAEILAKLKSGITIDDLMATPPPVPKEEEKSFDLLRGVDHSQPSYETRSGTATVRAMPDALAALLAAQNARQRPPITPVSTDSTKEGSEMSGL